MTNPIEQRAARKTALVVAAVLAAIAGWTRFRGGEAVPATLACFAGALVLAGLLTPPVAVRFHRAWMGLAAVLAFVNTRILLSVMYWGVMTPWGRLIRLFGRDALQRRGDGRETYWVARAASRQHRESFARTF